VRLKVGVYSFLLILKIYKDINMRVPFEKPNKESVLSVKQLQEEHYGRILAKPKQFIGYPVIVAIMTFMQILTVIFGNKQILLFNTFSVSLGWIWFMPLIFFSFQIVSECYGWQYARQIIWINFLINAMLAVIMYIFNHIPPHPELNKSDIENAYYIFLQYQTIPAVTMLISMFVADYISSALMCWSKFHWRGKYLIFRIIVLHCVGELVIGSGWLIIGPFYGYTFQQCISDSLDSFYARSIIMICLLPIASIVIWWIQNRLEGVIVFDLNIRFAPFKFRINPDESVQFAADGWHKLEARKVDPKDLAAHYNKELLEEKFKK